MSHFLILYIFLTVLHVQVIYYFCLICQKRRWKSRLYLVWVYVAWCARKSNRQISTITYLFPFFFLTICKNTHCLFFLVWKLMIDRFRSQTSLSSCLPVSCFQWFISMKDPAVFVLNWHFGSQLSIMVIKPQVIIDQYFCSWRFYEYLSWTKTAALTIQTLLC